MNKEAGARGDKVSGLDQPKVQAKQAFSMSAILNAEHEAQLTNYIVIRTQRRTIQGLLACPTSPLGLEKFIHTRDIIAPLPSNYPSQATSPWYES